MRRLIWPVVTGLMVLSLVLAACGPAAAPTTPAAPSITTPAPAPTSTPTPTPQPTPAPTPTPPPPAPPAPETPKYGGTLTYALTQDPTSFDSGSTNTGGALVDTVYQQFTSPDWTKGPAGSGVTNFAAGANGLEDYSPQVAESWSMPSLGVWVLNIRQDIHWQPVNSDAGKLMNGRLLTIDDIISEFYRMNGKTSWMMSGHPDVATTANISKTGPWQVTITTPVNQLIGWQWIVQGAGFYRVYPPDVSAKYGNMQNWRNAVGTGPFMLTDYVPSSQFMFAKNPNYWEKDPLGAGQGNKLPYVDSVRQLIIPDLSTQLAALRTGKLDVMPSVVSDDAASLWKTAPKLQYNPFMSNTPMAIGMRQDKKDKPFSDIRVRQALMYATDFDSFKKDYYGGNADIDVWPVNKQVNIMYQPLSEMPANVQDLFKYNPDKARQLLKDAGYPNGFKASIVVQNNATRIDELSIIKAMWAKVGIELNLDPKDPGTFTTLSGSTHPYDDLIYQTMFGSFTIHMTFSAVRSTALNNPSHINDPVGTIPFVEDLFTQYNNYVFVDWPKAYEVFKKLKPWMLENAFIIPRPTPFTYSFYWPWVKNYLGQGTTFIRYAWVDQDLKKSMGY